MLRWFAAFLFLLLSVLLGLIVFVGLSGVASAFAKMTICASLVMLVFLAVFDAVRGSPPI